MENEENISKEELKEVKDKKKTKKKTKKVEEVQILDTDTIYQNTVSLMGSLQCMKICQEKADMYRQAASQFKKLADFNDSEVYAKECEEAAKQTEEMLQKIIYKDAQDRMNLAKSAQDYKMLAEDFRKIKGYQDADKLADQCDKSYNNIENKAARKKVTTLGVIVACIILIIIGSTTKPAKFFLAKVYIAKGSYSSAIKVYQKLGNYKDSEQRIIDCHYRNGMSFKKRGKYISSVKAFAAAGNYKDSEAQKVAMEKQSIVSHKAGDLVKIGNFKWRILDIKGNKALLMKKTALPGMAYNSTASDVTWEKSTLRQWLNTEFLKEAFTKKERNNLIHSKLVNEDNKAYGTDGGNDTQDYIFLLSINEAQKYKYLFPVFKNNSWLRSPGNNQQNAAFLSPDGLAMDYGYTATSDKISVKPVFWFKLK